MSDIERRLRELGERARSDQPPAILPPHITRRVKRRRLATIGTSLVLAAGLAFGGAVAVGAFEPPPEIGPAEGRGDVLIEYHRTGGFAGEDVRLTVWTDGTASLTTVEDGETTTIEHDLRDIDLRKVKVAVDAVAWPIEVGDHRLGPNVQVLDGSRFELRHEEFAVSGEAGAAPTTVAALLRQLDGLVDALTPAPTNVRSCVGRIDFAPTYLPDGWMGHLQLGGGGGSEFPGERGHYGNGLDAGTRGKARGGFADLVEGASPYTQGNREEIEVLGSSASLGDIHEGFSVEFIYKGCDLVLVAYGIDREELGRFAEGLTTDRAGSEEEPFGAIWPEDTLAEAEASCAAAEGDREDPVAVAVAFATEVLGWSPEHLLLRGSGPDRRVEIRRSPDDDGPRAEGPAVMVYMHEFLDDCWSIGSVSRLPDKRPTGVSVGVTGRQFGIGFDDLGASSVTLIVGHGEHEMRVDRDDGKTLIEFRLDYAPTETGHFLLLFRDETGAVFSANGGPLPAGAAAFG